MASATRPFDDLPLDVLRVLFEECLLQWGLWHAVRHRLVSKFFDREIRKAICTTRYLERYPSRVQNKAIPRELKSQYLQYIIQIGNPGQVLLASIIQESISALNVDEGAQGLDDHATRINLMCKGVLSQDPAGWLYEGTILDRFVSRRSAYCTIENTLLTTTVLCGGLKSRPDLLEHVEHLSTPNAFFGTPLICAALTNSVESTDMLLKNGAKDNTLQSAIMIAASSGCDAVIETLLAADTDGSIYGARSKLYAALFGCAVRGGQISTIELLIARGLPTDNTTLVDDRLDWASWHRDEKMLRFLLANMTKAWESSSSNHTWLAEALSISRDISKTLMDALKIDDKVISEAAARAARSGCVDTLQYLLSRRLNIRLDKALTKAATNGHYYVVLWILSTPDLLFEATSTPMLKAAERGFHGVVLLLYRFLQRADHWDTRDEDVRRCLLLAKWHRHSNVVHALAELFEENIDSFNPESRIEMNALIQFRAPMEALPTPKRFCSPLCPVKGKEKI